MTLILGMSSMRRIGNVTQSRLVIAPLLNVTSSWRVSLTPMIVPPSAFRFICSGFTTMPGSTAVVTFSTRTLPVFGTTETCTAQAQYAFDRSITLKPWPRIASDPVVDAFGLGDGRVCHQLAAFFTVLITLTSRGALVLLRRNWIWSIFAAAASSLIIDS